MTRRKEHIQPTNIQPIEYNGHAFNHRDTIVYLTRLVRKQFNIKKYVQDVINRSHNVNHCTKSPLFNIYVFCIIKCRNYSF